MGRPPIHNVQPGDVFGKLIVTDLMRLQKRRAALCQCADGNWTVVEIQDLVKGHTKSCGCGSTNLKIAREATRVSPEAQQPHHTTS